MISWTDLSRSVARNTGFGREETKVIANEMILLLKEQLERGEEISIRGLGKFIWQPVKGGTVTDLNTGEPKEYPPGFKLKFRPSQSLSRRRAMEKYGVQLDEDKTKTASDKKGSERTCPQCGARLDSGSSCPAHGTEPLEKRRSEE